MEKFQTVIVPKTGWFDINLKEVWRYRDLISLFVKRNFVANYKQTILGPAWAVIRSFYCSIRISGRAGSRWGSAISLLSERKCCVDVFFYVFDSDGEYFYKQFSNIRQGIFPENCHAHFYGVY